MSGLHVFSVCIRSVAVNKIKFGGPGWRLSQKHSIFTQSLFLSDRYPGVGVIVHLEVIRPGVVTLMRGILSSGD